MHVERPILESSRSRDDITPVGQFSGGELTRSCTYNTNRIYYIPVSSTVHPDLRETRTEILFVGLCETHNHGKTPPAGDNTG